MKYHERMLQYIETRHVHEASPELPFKEAIRKSRRRKHVQKINIQSTEVTEQTT